jgi:type IV secretory pathway TraG/TraD family ATPase VirD4
MSLSLGEHEVEREAFTRTHGAKADTRSSQLQRVRERVVLPSEIASLPDLTGYLAFAGDYPVAKVKLDVLRFWDRVPAFKERKTC